MRLLDVTNCGNLRPTFKVAEVEVQLQQVQKKKVILLSVAAFPFQFFAKKKRYLQNFAKIQLRFVGVSIERCEAHNGVTGEISSTKQKSHKTSSGGFYKNYENDRLFTLFAVKNSCNILLFDNVFKYTIYSSIQA